MSIASYITPGAPLLGRVYSLYISDNSGTASVWGNELPGQSPLRVNFSIERVSNGPGSATVTLYNLATASRNALQAGTQVVLRAGYQGSMSRIFSGKISTVKTTRSGPDIATECTCDDGISFTAFSVLNRSYAAGTPLYQVLQDLAAAMLLDVSQETTAAAGAHVVGIPNARFEAGLAIEGPVRNTLTKICAKNMLVWSVVNGQLRVRPKMHFDTMPIVILNRESGLIDVPAMNANLLTASCLLLPGVYPGALVQVQSINQDLSGNYMVGKTKTDGDTYGGPWTIALEATPYAGSIETLPADSTGNFAAAVAPD